MDMTREAGIRFAIAAYIVDRPVIVYSLEAEFLHGLEELQGILSSGAGLTCTVLHLECTAEDWKASDWPECFEVARLLWLERRLPFKLTETTEKIF